MIPFTKKYLPKTSKEIIGQDEPISKIIRFIENFKSQKKRCMFVNGPVGCGKSSAVSAIANELNYELLEINASDTRNAAAIEEIVGNAMKTKSFFFKGKVIMVDEAEGISGTKDRGALTTVAKLLEKTSCPIILIANDAYDQKFSGIRKKCEVVDFNDLSVDDIFNIIKNISEKEKIQSDETILRTIARRVGGDARAAVTDMQILGVSGKISREETSAMDYREKEDSMQDALIKIFKNSDPLIAISAFERVNEAQDKLMPWVDESLPIEYKNPKDLARAYNFLSKADIFQRRIMRRQDWRYLVYINALMTAGVAVSNDERSKTPIGYKQSGRFLSIWIMNQKYAKRKSIGEKIAEKTHCSISEAIQDTVPFLKPMFEKGKGKEIAEELGLDSEEIAWLKK